MKNASALPWNAAALLLAVSTLLAACGGTGAPRIASAHSRGTSSGTTATPTESQADQVKVYLAQARAFVDCARAHGMPNVKDPDQYGDVLLPNDGDSAMAEVWRACQKLQTTRLPKPASLSAAQDKAAAAALTPAQIQMEEKWVTCMRDNGAPGVPDFDPQDPNDDSGPEAAADKQWADYGQATPGAQHAFKACQPIRDSYYGTR